MSELAEYLLEDQIAFEALLSRAVAEPRGFDLDAFQCFRARILRHIDIEESLLLTKPLSSSWRLRVEHRALEMLVRAQPSRRLVGEIRQLLLLHMGAEMGPGGALDEHARSVPASEQRALATRARQHPFRSASTGVAGDVARTASAALRAAEAAMCLPAVRGMRICAR